MQSNRDFYLWELLRVFEILERNLHRLVDQAANFKLECVFSDIGNTAVISHTVSINLSVSVGTKKQWVRTSDTYCW